jgi:hypothetical protein
MLFLTITIERAAEIAGSVTVLIVWQPSQCYQLRTFVCWV